MTGSGRSTAGEVARRPRSARSGRRGSRRRSGGRGRAASAGSSEAEITSIGAVIDGSAGAQVHAARSPPSRTRSPPGASRRASRGCADTGEPVSANSGVNQRADRGLDQGGHALGARGHGALQPHLARRQVAEVQQSTSRSMRSGAFAPSHMPVMPPIETPQSEARSISSRSISSSTSPPSSAKSYGPGVAGEPAVTALVVAEHPEAGGERRVLRRPHLVARCRASSRARPRARRAARSRVVELDAIRTGAPPGRDR